MFKLVMEMENVGKFETFPDVFREFFKKVKEMIKAGTSYQILETIILGPTPHDLFTLLIPTAGAFFILNRLSHMCVDITIKT